MNLEDVHERMQAFNTRLRSFHTLLEDSLSNLRSRHADLDAHWEQDPLRRKYDIEWEPLERSMEAYIKGTSHSYEEAFKTMIYYLEEFFDGSFQ